MTDPDHLPTLRFTAARLRDEVRDGLFDDSSGVEAAERIAEQLEAHIERAAQRQGDPSTWSEADWQRWHDIAGRAEREVADDPSGPW